MKVEGTHTKQTEAARMATQAARPGAIAGKTKATLYLDSALHQALRVRAAETGASMSDITERALRKELGMMARIDLDEVRTAYSNGVTEYEAIQIPWDTVRAILGHDHTGDSDEDRRLVDALLAAGAPEWVRDAEGWVDEGGWGLIGPECAGAGEDD